MGLDVVLYRLLHSGSGRRRSSSYTTVQVVADPHDVLVGLLQRVRGGGRTPLLDRLDPGGELVVAVEQVPGLLAELRWLGELTVSPAEAEQVRRLVALARRCLRDHDVALRFEGD
ncbi:hypothetical protein [Micromonospora sp. ATCC 39149]|uniref:Uncharacterized protein n=1 Tax=Micromonospora carbonacea TaxID=47853 RepID=A0A7D5Y9X8_9ACTN|nr:hypothetical protein [Micromonospora sp. ATCC 39149]QLJ99839.1 hypothetical protein HZU44_07010 [Micromonospora carbonacea]